MELAKTVIPEMEQRACVIVCMCARWRGGAVERESESSRDRVRGSVKPSVWRWQEGSSGQWSAEHVTE